MDVVEISLGKERRSALPQETEDTESAERACAITLAELIFVQGIPLVVAKPKPSVQAQEKTFR